MVNMMVTKFWKFSLIYKGAYFYVTMLPCISYIYTSVEQYSETCVLGHILVGKGIFDS
jgi:hypothetical protein